MSIENRRMDLMTVAAIASLAAVGVSVFHEALGHGGACLLMDGKPKLWTAVSFDWYSAPFGALSDKIGAAAGTVANLAMGAAAAGLLRGSSGQSAHWRYVLWLTMAANLLVGSGYLLYSGFSNQGDWAGVIAGAEPAPLWRGLLVAAGLALYGAAVAVSIGGMIRWIGGEPPELTRRAWTLTTVAYLGGGVLGCLGAARHPWGPATAAMWAGAWFGGASGLAWLAAYVRAGAPLPEGAAPLVVTRDWRWVAAGVAAAALLVGALGPGITFR